MQKEIELLEVILNIKITEKQAKEIRTEVLDKLYSDAWIKGCESGTSNPWI